jgi:YceI-like domain
MGTLRVQTLARQIVTREHHMLFSKWPARALAAVIIALAACTHVPAPVAVLPVVVQPAPPPVGKPAGSVDYRIDTAHSQLRVLAYRGGPLAAHGHNHVILSKGLSGWIRSGKLLKDSSFYLQLAPADFVIDPPEARAQEGADFAEAVDDAARAGTRRNMLGAALLDADRNPLILIQSTHVQSTGAEAGTAATATFRITIAGRTRLVTEPFAFDRQAGALHVTADFRLPQSTLGLTPFSALLGALQVADDMHLMLDILATTDQPVAPD